MDTDEIPLYPKIDSSAQIYKNQDMTVSPTAPTMPAESGAMLLGPQNCITVCQFCKASIKTAVKYTTTTRTHTLAVLFCLLWCCCCIPHCMNSAKNTDHYCPNCQRYLGTYQK